MRFMFTMKQSGTFDLVVITLTKIRSTFMMPSLRRCTVLDTKRTDVHLKRLIFATRRCSTGSNRTKPWGV